MMKRSEQVVKSWGDAHVLRPAEGVQRVSVLDARLAVSPIAAVRPALISLTIQKASFIWRSIIYPATITTTSAIKAPSGDILGSIIVMQNWVLSHMVQFFFYFWRLHSLSLQEMLRDVLPISPLAFSSYSSLENIADRWNGESHG